MEKILKLLIISLFFAASCKKEAEKAGNSLPPVSANQPEVSPKIQNLINTLEPFSEKTEAPKPGEWLASFSEEGQTFEHYINQNPTLPTEQRNILYIQPLGNFSFVQTTAIKAAAEYLSIFFGLPVKLLPPKQFDKPLRLANRRLNPLAENEQIKTGYILDEILKPNLPENAAALIAFTDKDLFPDQNFNFVFGQASLENRVGVWSLYRLNDEKDFSMFLKRTLKIASHETGHMFSIKHCNQYKCVMNGSISLAETDRHPLDACPEETAKIYLLSNKNPAQRYFELAKFCGKYNLAEESKIFKRKFESVRKLDFSN